MKYWIGQIFDFAINKEIEDEGILSKNLIVCLKLEIQFHIFWIFRVDAKICYFSSYIAFLVNITVGLFRKIYSITRRKVL